MRTASGCTVGCARRHMRRHGELNAHPGGSTSAEPQTLTQHVLHVVLALLLSPISLATASARFSSSSPAHHRTTSSASLRLDSSSRQLISLSQPSAPTPLLPLPNLRPEHCVKTCTTHYARTHPPPPLHNSGPRAPHPRPSHHNVQPSPGAHLGRRRGVRIRLCTRPRLHSPSRTHRRRPAA